jgi:hypothetical protein
VAASIAAEGLTSSPVTAISAVPSVAAIGTVAPVGPIAAIALAWLLPCLALRTGVGSNAAALSVIAAVSVAAARAATASVVGGGRRWRRWRRRRDFGGRGSLGAWRRFRCCFGARFASSVAFTGGEVVAVRIVASLAI